MTAGFLLRSCSRYLLSRGMQNEIINCVPLTSLPSLFPFDAGLEFDRLFPGIMQLIFAGPFD